MRHAGGWNSLHTRSRALVRNNRDARAPQRGVRIIGTPPAERVIGLGQQLEHQLVWAQAQTQQHRIITVIRSGVVGFFQQERGGQLDGFMAPGGGVHVTGSRGFLFFIKAGHSGGSVHQAVSTTQQVGGKSGYGGGWSGKDSGGRSSGIGYAGRGRVGSFGSSRSSEFRHQWQGG